jgi:1-aminocyclopropane-1-carboxylate deaminase/D-cysteine desulfhydrase-like pyridoxal-dependent ACC family enzyme
MKALRQYLGTATRLFIKRDDLTPFGGGKFRKAAVLVDRAAQTGAAVVLTEGAVESRHARATAIAARLLGLRCILVLSPERDAENLGPTLLDEPEGAEIVMVPSENDRAIVCDKLRADLEASGQTVAVIPFSGSTAETALAYAHAFDEVMTQLACVNGLPCTIFLASATGGIQAGLELGKARRRAGDVHINGVSPGFPTEQVKSQVACLASAAASLIGEPLAVRMDDICVLGGYAALGYLNTTPEARSAGALVKELENVTLDPIYTAKAFAALLDQVRDKSFDSPVTVFWHTAG